jgi:preprotein translocase subunit SecG
MDIVNVIVIAVVIGLAITGVVLLRKANRNRNGTLGRGSGNSGRGGANRH